MHFIIEPCIALVQASDAACCDILRPRPQAVHGGMESQCDSFSVHNQLKAEACISCLCMKQ